MISLAADAAAALAAIGFDAGAGALADAADVVADVVDFDSSDLPHADNTHAETQTTANTPHARRTPEKVMDCPFLCCRNESGSVTQCYS